MSAPYMLSRERAHLKLIFSFLEKIDLKLRKNLKLYYSYIL
jgi:hypothetical protein